MKQIRSFIIIIALFLYTAGCSPGTIPDQELQTPAAEQRYSIHQELADLIAAKKERASARPTGLEEKPIKEETPNKEENSKPEPAGAPQKETAVQPEPQPQPKPQPEKEEKPPEKPEPAPQPACFEEEETLLSSWPMRPGPLRAEICWRLIPPCAPPPGPKARTWPITILSVMPPLHILILSNS